MDLKDIGKFTSELRDKYPEAGIRNIELDPSTGKASLYLMPTAKALASLPPERAIKLRYLERATTLRRNVLSRPDLDLAQGYKSVYDEDPKKLFERALRYYCEQDAYGAHIDILTNLSSKGFENDVDDENIRHFFDVWSFDVGLRQVLSWIFFDFFRVGMVRTYKIVGKYEPGISYLSPIPGTKVEKSILKELGERHKKLMELREKGQKKKKWSKGYIPISYTILNPLNVEIAGSLLFDNTQVTLTPSKELQDMLKKPGGELTEDEKELIKLLPSDFKSAIEKGEGMPLDPAYVGAVDYRKMPYERYPKPKGAKVFDALEYKNALRQADLSTLDGITNYILKITIGNDAFPVTEQSQLEAVAKLFDTTSKSFDVVWNHTLEIEKIVSPEIGDILGEAKYTQVNNDITGGTAMSRAFIDGSVNLDQASMAILTKTMIEEIAYARSQVELWIYNEYREIAEAQGFDRFPRVRWDNTVLKDIILYMATISQLVDRRMLSYRTALEQLGFDYDAEFGNMENELPSVLEGILGIKGSPFQQSKFGAPGVQPVQGTPKGTPSGGRPKGQPAKPKTPNTKVNDKTKVPNQAPSQQPKPSKQASSVIIQEAAKLLNPEEFEAFVDGFLGELNSNDED